MHKRMLTWLAGTRPKGGQGLDLALAVHPRDAE